MNFNEIVLKINDLQDDYINLLSDRQKEIIDYLKKGYTVSQIAKVIGRSRQNVYVTIQNILDVSKIKHIKKETVSRQKNSSALYKQYSDYDLSILSPREKSVMEIIINNPSLSSKDIASIVNISVGNVNKILYTARKKLNNDYDDLRQKSRENHAKWIEKNKTKSSEYFKRYYEQNKERLNDYSAKYYSEHREEILGKMRKSRKRK